MMNFLYLFSYFVIYSFIGWVYESTLCTITDKKPVNRGFLTGPVCPIYGVGALFVVLVLGDSDLDIIPLFLSGGVLTCTLEYFTSWAMEKLFSARWWDYSYMRFNLNGRVCLLGFVAFGAFSVALVRWIHPWVVSLIAKIPFGWLLGCSIVVFLVFVADLSVTVYHALDMAKRLKEVQAAIEKGLEEAGERHQEWRQVQLQKISDAQSLFKEYSAKLREQSEAALKKLEQGEFYENFPRQGKRPGFQVRRLLAAFPRFNSPQTAEAVAQLKRRIAEYKEQNKENKRKRRSSKKSKA